MLKAGRAPWRELQVKVAIFPGFDMPAEKLVVCPPAPAKSKAHMEEESTPQIHPRPSFLRGTEFKVQIQSWHSCYGD